MKKIIILVFVVLLNACASTYSPFKFVDNNYKPNGNRLAIISALFEVDTKIFTTKFEKEMKTTSKYNIITQRRIKKRLGAYPIKIIGPYKNALSKIEEDYNRTDVKTIINMGNKLKVDYIYAIWIPSKKHSKNFSIYELFTIMQIFEISTGKEIARMKFPITWQTEGGSLGTKLPRNKNDAMNDIAAKLSKHIAEKMGMLKDQ